MASIETGELTLADSGISTALDAKSVALSGGRTLLVWPAETATGTYEAFGKIVDADGKPVGNTFQISKGVGNVFGVDTALLSDGKVAVVFDAKAVGSSAAAPIKAVVFDPTSAANGGAIPAAFDVADPDAPYVSAQVEVYSGKLAFVWTEGSGADPYDGKLVGKVLDPTTYKVLTAETQLGSGNFKNVEVLGAGTGLVITSNEQYSNGPFTFPSYGFAVDVYTAGFTKIQSGGQTPSGDDSYGLGGVSLFGTGIIASYSTSNTKAKTSSGGIAVFTGDKLVGGWTAPEGNGGARPYIVGDKIVAVYGNKGQVLSYTTNSVNGVTYYTFKEEGPAFTIDSDLHGVDISANGSRFLATWLEQDGVVKPSLVGQVFTTVGTETGLQTEIDYADVDAGATTSGNLLANDLGSGRGVTQISTSTATAAVTTSTVIAGKYGTLTVSAGGGYTYKADKDAAFKLAEGNTDYDLFTYRAKNGDGDTDTSKVWITVTGKATGGARNVAFSADPLFKETSPTGTVAGKVTYDASESVTFSLVDNAGKPFAIDAQGNITTTGAVDHETKAFYDVKVSLKGQTSGTTTTATLRVNVPDVDEAPSTPTFATSNAKDSHGVYGLAGGTTGKLGTLSSADPEGGRVTYGLDAQFYGPQGYVTSDAFAIVNGELQATKALANGYYYLSVNAEDAGNNSSQFISVQFQVSAPNGAPMITSNGGAATVTLLRKENVKDLPTVTASDAQGSYVTYTKVGGADASKFSLDYYTGKLTFLSAPDYERPKDADKKNTYDVKVRATDQGGLFDEQTIRVKIDDVNEYKPSIVSPSKAASATVNVNEGVRYVTEIEAEDADKSAELTFKKIGGTDQSKFTLNAKTGDLTFNGKPDYERPTDSNKDNVYQVKVQVSDGSKTDTQTLSVKVKDVGGPNRLVADTDSHGDTFVFEKGDAGKTPGTWAKLYGFTPGHDTIDLSGIDADPARGDQAFRFVDHFSAPKGSESDGQVRVVDHGRDVKVEIDYDGNNHTDMVIQVMNVAKLMAGDFHL